MQLSLRTLSLRTAVTVGYLMLTDPYDIIQE